jgi:hypothetical protein
MVAVGTGKVVLVDVGITGTVEVVGALLVGVEQAASTRAIITKGAIFLIEPRCILWILVNILIIICSYSRVINSTISIPA